MAARNLTLQRLRVLASAGVGLATGAAVTLAAQRPALNALRTRVEQLERAAQPKPRADLARQQEQHWRLLTKAIDDPDLAEVLDIYRGSVSPKKQRQFLFANALYTNTLCYYRMGNMTREEFLGFVRSMLQNPIFREYWHASSNGREPLSKSSEEAKLGRMVDDLPMHLEEVDNDEWWVAGN